MNKNPHRFRGNKEFENSIRQLGDSKMSGTASNGSLKEETHGINRKGNICILLNMFATAAGSTGPKPGGPPTSSYVGVSAPVVVSAA